MITMNSLAAFTAEVSRPNGPIQARGSAPPQNAMQASPAAPQRKLEALPAMPGAPPPRGSLLDLRV